MSGKRDGTRAEREGKINFTPKPNGNMRGFGRKKRGGAKFHPNASNVAINSKQMSPSMVKLELN